MNYMGRNAVAFRRCIYAFPIFAFGVSLVLLACQPFEIAPGYGSIHPRHLLMIPREGKLHITWEARHLIVTLKGSVRQGILSINGTINRNPGTEQFDTLDNVVVDIYMTNKVGKILKSEILVSTDNPPSSLVLHELKNEYKLPKSTTHIAFGYELNTGSRQLRHFPVE